MASLPPRRLNTPSRPSNKHHQTELQILLQMGVPKARAEKALASTGHRGVQLASDWLLAHVNDPFLDDDNPREYILYVCPTGALLEELEKFWIETRTTCGWNGAHNFTPHITLVSFFKAPDECALQLSKTLKQVVENMGAALQRSIALERYISPNFMGYFVPDEDAEYLKHIALQFVKEVSHSITGDTNEHLDALVTCFPWCAVTSARCIPKSSRSISLESHVKSLHLTLAYQFPTSNYNGLVNFVEALETTSSSNWELRLYSRDARLATRQVYKVLFPHRSEHPDELELRIGDYIYINPDSLQNSADGWVEGISWLTGVSGFLPQNYVERVAECEAWTIHTVVPLRQFGEDDEEDCEIVDDVDGAMDLISQAETASVRDPESVSDKIEKTIPLDMFSNPKDVMQLIEKKSSILSLNSSSSHETPASSSDTRKIYVMRHGERVDFTFGDYIPHCFDVAGNYTQKDLNMPEKFHPKKNGFTSWSKDSPLTNVGIYQAKLVGAGLRKSAVQLDTVYCSPAFRCVQTCDALLEGFGIKSSCKIRIEPCLFEWLAWYQDGVPDFYEAQELQNLEFNIDTSYEPLMTIADLQSKLGENIEEFYDRNAQLSEVVAKNNSLGNVLFVGHAITLDTCTRKLLNREIRASSEIARLMHKISYCSLIAVESSKTEFQMWELTEPPFSQMTHTNNQRFDWHAIDT